MPLSEDRLQAMAELLVRVGLDLQDAQQLVVSAPVEALPLVRAVAKVAYSQGCSLVTPLLSDPQISLARLENANEAALDTSGEWLAEGIAKAYGDGAARLAITGADPNLLSGIDPARVARAERASGPARRLTGKFSSESIINWTVAPYPVLGWAKAVFPDDDDAAALTNLEDHISHFLRLDEADPVAAWMTHNNGLAERAGRLNALGLDALHFRSEGTDLRVGLADNHHWHGGQTPAQNGPKGNTNMPTEEVFSCPHRERVEGYATSTRPLVVGGVTIPGIRVTFENGAVTKINTLDGGRSEILESMISTDEGASRLGEVALVPNSSRISKMHTLYLNTLLDENSSCHIAFGQSYRKCLQNGPSLSADEVAALGANASRVHFDWMIGASDTSIDGIADGEAVPLMRDGEWC